MISTPDLVIFLAACLALNVTPGADMMFTIASGLRSGAQAGLSAALGVSAGLGVHVLAASLGVAALLAAHPAGFEILRWAGVFWLLWLAIEAFRAKPPETAQSAAGLAASFRGGFLVNLFNPKTIIFILAFLPQFAAHGTLGEFLMLGGIFMATSTLVNGAIGMFAGRIGPRLAKASFLNRISGGVMLALAARLAFSELKA